MILYLRAEGFRETGIDVISVRIGVEWITYTDIENNTFSVRMKDFITIRIEKQ